MELPRRISERFGLSDLFLFTSGGCHVFAKALSDLMPREAYELRHLRGRGPLKAEKLGYHIYLYKDGFAVDALGIRRERDMIAAFNEAKHGWTFTAEPCTFELLFQEAENRDETGPLNAWELYLHPDYVAYLEAKARLLIQDCPSRFSVINLQRGLKLLDDVERLMGEIFNDEASRG
jgi:hypothetical protein